MVDKHYKNKIEESLKKMERIIREYRSGYHTKKPLIHNQNFNQAERTYLYFYNEARRKIKDNLDGYNEIYESIMKQYYRLSSYSKKTTLESRINTERDKKERYIGLNNLRFND